MLQWEYQESWALKNWCLELWCWRRLLRAPWTARRSNPSILKEISPEYSLEGLMLKLKLLILWPPDAKNWLLGSWPSWSQTLILKKIEGSRKRGQQRMRWLDGISNSMEMSWASSRSWWWTGKPGVLQSMGSQRVRYDWATELNWVIHLPSILNYGACPYVFCFNDSSIKSFLIFSTIVICISFSLSHGSILTMLGKWKVQ